MPIDIFSKLRALGLTSDQCTDVEELLKDILYTPEEVERLLVRMYMETAGSHNDYGKDMWDYEDAGMTYTKEFMKNNSCGIVKIDN